MGFILYHDRFWSLYGCDFLLYIQSIISKLERASMLMNSAIMYGMLSFPFLYIMPLKILSRTHMKFYSDIRFLLNNNHEFAIDLPINGMAMLLVPE